jgi:protein-disulfide isomerase-like protein with CxxC motif
VRFDVSGAGHAASTAYLADHRRLQVVAAISRSSIMIGRSTLAFGFLLSLGIGAALAQDEAMASPEEAAKVSEAIAKIGCKAEEIEKENANLYEIDDAVCEIGQYDIKLNGDFKITVMTGDD